MSGKESEFRAVWRQGRVYGLGNALNRVAALLLIPVLLHSLSTEEWGAYALILIFSQALSMGASVINDAMARVYYDYDDEPARRQVDDLTERAAAARLEQRGDHTPLAIRGLPGNGRHAACIGHQPGLLDRSAARCNVHQLPQPASAVTPCQSPGRALATSSAAR